MMHTQILQPDLKGKLSGPTAIYCNAKDDALKITRHITKPLFDNTQKSVSRRGCPIRTCFLPSEAFFERR